MAYVVNGINAKCFKVIKNLYQWIKASVVLFWNVWVNQGEDLWLILFLAHLSCKAHGPLVENDLENCLVEKEFKNEMQRFTRTIKKLWIILVYWFWFKNQNKYTTNDLFWFLNQNQ